MNVILLPVQHKSQTQRQAARLETISRSSACGHENPLEAAFCGECGALLSPQSLSCATCGQPTPASLAFCRNCDASHSPASASAAPSTATTHRTAGERFSQSSLH